MIRKVLLIGSLVAGAFTGPAVAAQQTTASSRQSFDQSLQSAEKARDENRNDEAIELFRRALSEQPESEQALWYLGTLLYEKEQYAKARDVLRQFLTIRPDAGPGWALLGLGEFQLHEYPRALDHLQRAMSQGMGERKEMVQSVFHEVAALLTRFERYDDSLDMLSKMLASGLQDPSLIEPAGLAGLRLPLLPTEIPPDRRDLVDLAGRAVLAVQTQQYETAEVEFKRLIAAYPNEPGVHFLYGAYLVQLHPNEAMPEFKRELEISPARARPGSSGGANDRAERFRPRPGARARSHQARAQARLRSHACRGSLDRQGQRGRRHQGTGNRARKRSVSEQNSLGFTSRLWRRRAQRRCGPREAGA